MPRTTMLLPMLFLTFRVVVSTEYSALYLPPPNALGTETDGATVAADASEIASNAPRMNAFIFAMRPSSKKFTCFLVLPYYAGIRIKSFLHRRFWHLYPTLCSCRHSKPG